MKFLTEAVTLSFIINIHHWPHIQCLQFYSRLINITMSESVLPNQFYRLLRLSYYLSQLSENPFIVNKIDTKSKAKYLSTSHAISYLLKKSGCIFNSFSKHGHGHMLFL